MSTTWWDLTELINLEDQSNEIHKKFKGTILGIQTKFNTIYAYLCDYKNPFFIFVDKHHIKIHIHIQTAYKIFIPQIESGYYSVNNVCFYIHKENKRQWRRGICEDTYRLMSVFNLFEHWEIVPYIFYEKIISILENKETLQELNKELLIACNKTTFCSINRNFLISVSTQKPKGYSLFFHNVYVGELCYKLNKIHIYIKDKTFIQELTDTIDTWCPSYKLIYEYD